MGINLIEKNVYVIWTSYIDSRLTRRMGRKISLREAVNNPRLNELVDASKRLGLHIVKVKEARYPSSWWIRDSGYIMIRKIDDKKLKIIRLIAREIRRMRGGR